MIVRPTTAALATAGSRMASRTQSAGRDVPASIGPMGATINTPTATTATTAAAAPTRWGGGLVPWGRPSE